MNNQQLASCIGIADKEIVSIYGAGGKSTLLYLLASELSGGGKQVVITTTTKIYRHPHFTTLLSPTWEGAAGKLGEQFTGKDPLILARDLLPEGKLGGIDPSWPGRLIEDRGVSHVLAECDGAARRPLKGYAPYEPVLPPESGIIMPVLGLGCLGTPLDKRGVHRPELFSAMTGLKIGDTIGVEHLVGGMKWMIERGLRQAPRARVVPVFNQVDLLSDRQVIIRTAALMAGCPHIDRLIFTAARQHPPVQFIYNIHSSRAVAEVSCVLLAAGFSRRMGRPKLTLELDGSTVLEHTIRKVMLSGVKETIVVTNSEPAAQNAGLSKINPRYIVNKYASRGISTSLQAGLAAVSPISQGVIFALGDQPLIPSSVYEKLRDNYSLRLPLAVYPTFQGRRGNPVLFDRRTWPRLMELEGDKGGSGLFAGMSQHELYGVEMDNPEILVDLDTPGDYEYILNRVKPGFIDED